MGGLENRARFLIETTRAVRRATPNGFLVSVKLNSADFQRGGFDADDSIVVAAAIEREGIDLLEISGGTYESAAMFSGGPPKRESTRRREAYFLEFAERFARELSVPLMLTGGFRTTEGMDAAVRDGAVDVVGLARPMAHEPYLPERLLDGHAVVSGARRRVMIGTNGHAMVRQVIGTKGLDDYVDGAWHQQQIARLGHGKPVAADRRPSVALAIGAAVSVRDAVLTRLPAPASRLIDRLAGQVPTS